MKKIIIVSLLILVLIAGAYYHISGLPQYTFFKISKAIKAHDIESFYKYVDVDSIVDRWVDVMVEEMNKEMLAYEPESGWEALGTVMGAGMVHLMVPNIRSQAKDYIKREVERKIEFISGATDKIAEEADKRHIKVAEDELNIPQTLPDAFELIQRPILKIKKEGKITHVTFKLEQKEIERFSDIVFKMRQMSDRYWKIVEIDIPSFKDELFKGNKEAIDQQAIQTAEVLDTKKQKVVDLKEFLTSFNEIAQDYYRGYDNAWIGYEETCKPHRKCFQIRKFAVNPNIYFADEFFQKAYTELTDLHCDNEVALEIRDSYLKSIEKAKEGIQLILQGFKGHISAYTPPDWRTTEEGMAKIHISLESAYKANGELLKLVEDNLPDLEKKMLPVFIIDPYDKDSPYLGFSYTLSTKEIRIVYIWPKSPAEKARLMPGDVILGIENGETFPSMIEYCEYVKKCKAGDKISLMIYRYGEEKIIKVKLGRKL